MKNSGYFFLVLAMGLVTYLPRMLPLVLLSRRKLPLWLAAVPTLLFALKTRSLAGTVIIGMLAFWGTRFLM